MISSEIYQNVTSEKSLFLLDKVRSAAIRIGIVAAIFSVAGYYCAGPVLQYLQQITAIKLVSYGLPDIFFSYIKLAVTIGIAASLPYAFYALLAIVPVYLPEFSRRRMFCFWLASVFLFILGVLFCVKVSLPYGIQFLLSFETSHIAASISVKKFVSFCLLMLLGFGLIFELPLVMILTARMGLITAQKLAGYRRYAILIIFIAAAVITPTPDIFNLFLMAVPLYLLFELGLLGMRWL